MIRAVLHRLAAAPRVYDFIQRMAGSATLRARLVDAMGAGEASGTVVDVGGGTALNSGVVARRAYVCVDVDERKLAGVPPHLARVLGDARSLPIRSGAADVVLATALSHHLDAAGVESMLGEAARVLAPHGRLVFADALRAPRLRSRLLWWLDRGAHPRSETELLALIDAHFEVERSERLALLHRFLLVVARPRERSARA